MALVVNDNEWSTAGLAVPPLLEQVPQGLLGNVKSDTEDATVALLFVPLIEAADGRNEQEAAAGIGHGFGSAFEQGLNIKFADEAAVLASREIRKRLPHNDAAFREPQHYWLYAQL